MDAGISDESPEIGTIIRKHFPKDGAVHDDLTKAWFPKQHPARASAFGQSRHGYGLANV